MSTEWVMPSNHLILCRPLQSFPASESFPTSWLFAPGGQSIGELLAMQIFRSHSRPTESETQGLGQGPWGLRSAPGDSDGVLVKLKQAFSTRVVLLANLSLRHLAMSDDLLGCPSLRWWWWVGDGQGGLACWQFMGLQRVGRLSDQTEREVGVLLPSSGQRSAMRVHSLQCMRLSALRRRTPPQGSPAQSVQSFETERFCTKSFRRNFLNVGNLSLQKGRMN